MTLEEYYKDTASGESQTVEFKSWVKASGFKEVINLAVDELIAFANADGGTVYFGRSLRLSMIRQDHHYLQRLM